MEKEIERKAKEKMSQAMAAKHQNKLGEALLLLGVLAEMLLEIEDDWADLLYAEMIHQRGVVLMMDKNWAGSYENLMDAARMRKRLYDDMGLAYTVFQIAMLKLEQTGNEQAATPSFLKARPYVRRAIEIAEETGDKKALGNMKHKDAFIDQIMKVYQNAITGYCNALTSRIKAGDKRGEALTKARMAECYLAINEIKNAEILTNEALKYFRDNDDIKRIEQVLKTKKAILAKKIDQKTKELNELYAKATTEKDYQLVIAKTAEISELLSDNEEIIAKTLNAWWAQYHLLRLSKESEARKKFVDTLRQWYPVLKKPEIKIRFGYLYATAMANFIPIGKGIEIVKINAEIKDIAEKSGNVSLILREITSRGLKEMAEKNWPEAVKIFNEIDSFPVEILLKQENLLHAGNITNNRGASLIRGNINPIDGAMSLLKAAEYYSQLEQPPAKHFESKGLSGRLQESLDKLLSSESAIINPSKEIVVLIGEAKTILLPVSDKIKEAQPSREYFDSLINNLKKIRERIAELNK